MELLKEYWLPWSISNIIGLLFIWAAVKRTRLARLLFALLFGWASWLNYTVAHADPNDYMNYASMTPFPFYRDFINGWFSENIIGMVTLISIGQGLIAFAMLLRDLWVRMAAIAAIVFFIAISPLGIGSGFPAPLFSALAAYFILKKDAHDYLWVKSSR